MLTSGACPRLGRVVIDLSGKRGGQAGREQCVAGNRLDQLSRQGRLAPGDPSPAVNFNELGMRTWPHKGQSVVARREQALAGKFTHGSHRLGLFSAHDVGLHPAVPSRC